MLSRSLFAALLVLFLTHSGTAADQPNVLFIAVDDLNDWIGCLEGHPQALTPNMDRLASRGVLFTNAHCASPACNPSRAAVFSGRMPGATGVWSNDSDKLDKVYPKSRLFTSLLSASGYRTAGTGKLLHAKSSWAFDEYKQIQQRWSPLTKKAVEYTEKELPTKRTSNPRHIVRDSLGRRIVLPLNRMPSDRRPDVRGGESFDWGPFDVPDSDFGDTQITEWAMGRLKKGFDKPFFLAVGYYRPHIPLWAPKRFFDRFAKTPAQLPQTKVKDLDDLSSTAKKWALEAITAGSHATVVKHQQWQTAVEGYLACTTYVDYEIGRLLDALDASRFGDNTAIVLWSDHGWHLGEKQHWGKWTGWERSTRVPLIFVPPKKLAAKFAAAGSRCDRAVSLIDLYPTIAELCGVSAPDDLDGTSLIPLLRDPNSKTGRRILTLFDRGNASLRGHRWRYIRYADGSEELYDHHSDPEEWTNLAGSAPHSEQLQKSREELEKQERP